MSSIDTYKIKKELGHGVFGIVYLAIKNDKKYALKIEHILKKDIKKDTRTVIWREIDFAEKFASKYPNQFIQLIDYDIIKDYNFKPIREFTMSKLSVKHKENLIKLDNSRYCIRKIYSIVDGSLNSIIDKLSVKKFYSMLIQIIYICHILHEAGYVHNDLHSGNIGYIKTEKKYINILGNKIPTYGKIYQALDFGLVMHRKYLATRIDRKMYADSIINETRYLRNLFTDFDLWGYAEGRNIKINMDTCEKKLRMTKEYELLSEFSTYYWDILFMYQILFAEKFQKIYLGKGYKHTLPIKLRIPTEDMIIFFKLANEPIKLINYFSGRLPMDKK